MIARRALLLFSLVTLGGCATLDDLWSSLGKGAGADAVPLNERPVEDPLDPNVFALESADQSVIGEPQVVFATKTRYPTWRAPMVWATTRSSRPTRTSIRGFPVPERPSYCRRSMCCRTSKDVALF